MACVWHGAALHPDGVTCCDHKLFCACNFCMLLCVERLLGTAPAHDVGLGTRATPLFAWSEAGTLRRPQAAGSDGGAAGANLAPRGTGAGEGAQRGRAAGDPGEPPARGRPAASPRADARPETSSLRSMSDTRKAKFRKLLDEQVPPAARP